MTTVSHCRLLLGGSCGGHGSSSCKNRFEGMRAPGPTTANLQRQVLPIREADTDQLWHGERPLLADQGRAGLFTNIFGIQELLRILADWTGIGSPRARHQKVTHDRIQQHQINERFDMCCCACTFLLLWNHIGAVVAVPRFSSVTVQKRKD